MPSEPDERRPRTIRELRENTQIRMLTTPVMDPDLSEPAPEHVWHYTDALGAAGIIGGRELWATDGLFLNDASELQLIHEPFMRVLRVEKASPFLSDAERTTLLETFEKSLVDFREDPGLYVVCFCESGDLLSQWRSYGRLGGGYALGFDAAALCSYDRSVVGELDFFRVIYERKEQLDAAVGFCAPALDELARFLRGCDSAERTIAVEATGESLGLMAQWFSARVKNAAFAEEREWRFVCRNPTKPSKGASYPRRFRVSERGLMPYLSLRLGEIGKDTAPGSAFPLARVRVGPTATTELSSRAMNYLLKDHGFGFEAEQSVIPLRA